MKKNNLRQKDILDLLEPFCRLYDVKFNKSDLSQYLSGKSEPNQDKLYILSEALKVNVAWLMGYDVPINITDFSNSTSSNLSDEEYLIIKNYRKLNDEGKERLLNYSDDLVSSKKYIQSDTLGLDKKVG